MTHQTVEFGTFLTQPSGVAEAARRAEDLGYDVLACGEHVMFHGPTSNSFVSLACAAGATTRIRLMSAIVLLPLYPAALAAKLGAALDVASGGRYVFGVGVGGEFPKEFEACGVPVRERGVRANEALEVIRRLWTEEEVSFHGRFTTLRGTSLRPRPVQRPHPPVWVAGRKEPAMQRAARYGDGWLPYMYTPEQLQESLVNIRHLCEKAGRDPSALRGGIFLWSAVEEEGDRARRSVVEFLSTTYAQDFSELAGRYALAGDPGECSARLREYVDAGASLVVLAPAYRDRDAAEASTELAARTVLPALRHGAAP